jgi:hypothetical protein
LKERYGWTAQRCQDEWDAAKGDSMIPKKPDQYGYITVGWIENISGKSGRKLSHDKTIIADEELEEGCDLRAVKDSTFLSTLEATLLCF